MGTNFRTASSHSCASCHSWLPFFLSVLGASRRLGGEWLQALAIIASLPIECLRDDDRAPATCEAQHGRSAA
jgi:hypothetical protein